MVSTASSILVSQSRGQTKKGANYFDNHNKTEQKSKGPKRSNQGSSFLLFSLRMIFLLRLNTTSIIHLFIAVTAMTMLLFSSAAKTTTFLRYSHRYQSVSASRTLLSWFRGGGGGGGGGGGNDNSKLEMDDDFGPLKAKDIAKERSYNKLLWNQHPLSVSAVCGYRS